MSNARVEDSKLRGYDGPFFPDALGEMHQLLYGIDAVNFNGSVLEEVVHEYGRRYSVERLTGSDNYDWFWCIIITSGNTTVVIALPWGQDWDHSDGTQSDRSSAVYTCGAVSQEACSELLRLFTCGMKIRSEEIIATA